MVDSSEPADGIVVASGLVKRFGEVTAVDGVSFSIAEGEVFGLLGPNGAGKSTTISVIDCLIEPTEGDVTVDGASVRADPARVKRALGVVPQDIALYPSLTARENLLFWGRMYGLAGRVLEDRVADALQLAGLVDRASERIETYSGGMKRRVNIVAGILHHPRVLLMDEPTVGIDPQSRNHILETVKRLNQGGMTVLYTSHYMEEVEYLCDRVAIMDHGRVIASGTIDELKRLVGDEHVISVQVENLPEGAVASVSALPGVDGASCTGEACAEGAVEVLTKDSGAALAPVVSALGAAGAHITAVDVREPDLESVFLHLTGKSLRD